MRPSKLAPLALLALAACGPDAGLLVVVDGEGFVAGEVATVVLDVRGDDGTLTSGSFPVPAGAQLPFSVDVELEEATRVRTVVVELRGNREALARSAFAATPAEGEILELHASLRRGVFDEGCADLDGDGHGQGPGCVGEDCDDTDAGRSFSAEEACGDGLDNDCDGGLDEDCACEPGATQPCHVSPAGAIGLGPCVAGTMTCDEDGLWGACEGEVTPLPEPAGVLGVDDDCDGVFDEAEACGEGEVVPCYDGPAGTLGVGVCRGGVRTCEEGVFGECEEQVVPSEELCASELDEDCDGLFDEPADCGGGPLVFHVTPEDPAGFTASGPAVDPQPCADELAFAMQGGTVTFSSGPLELSGAAYASVVAELSIRPELGTAILGYETAAGTSEFTEVAELVGEATADCGRPDSVELWGPWIETEVVTRLHLTFSCVDPAACEGAPITLRTVEVY